MNVPEELFEHLVGAWQYTWETDPTNCPVDYDESMEQIEKIRLDTTDKVWVLTTLVAARLKNNRSSLDFVEKAMDRLKAIADKIMEDAS